MFKIGTPPINSDASSFAFKKWFQDIYTWSKGGVLIPTGGYIPEQSGVVALAGAKNLLLNGGFNIWQRGTSIANGAGTTNYTADRWATTRPTASTVTVAQTSTTGLTGIPSYARVSRGAADTTIDPIYLAQALETNDCIRLRSQYVTLSFWARCGSGFAGSVIANNGTLAAIVTSGTGVDQGPFTAFVGGVTVVTKYIVPSTTWTYYQVTGQVPSNSTQLKMFFQWNPTAAAGANNYIDVTGVQLEIGSKATAFESLEFGKELDRCFRYYQKSFPYVTTPAQNAGNSGALFYRATAAGVSNSNGRHILALMTEIRTATPTVTTYNPGAANANWRNITLGADSGVPTAGTATGTKYISIINPQVAGDALGNDIGIHWTVDAEL